MKFFKFLIIVILCTFIAKTFAQLPPNIGFEDGTFNNWQCYSGAISPAGQIFVSNKGPILGQHTILGKESSQIIDPYGYFPVLCPNGSNYSVRLGNSISSAKADRLSYTFIVPSSGPYSIIFNYAIVLENPFHLSYQQPQFTARVFDVSDNVYVDCPSFDFLAGSYLPGFKLATGRVYKDLSIYYKDWSTATIDLRAYHNKTIRLEFTTNDCTLGGHFGYAYLDIDENAMLTPITGNAYCNGQNSVTLYGPNGFQSYYWYNANMTKQIGSGQSIVISPPPPDLTQYVLKVLPYPNLGCVDTLYTIVNKINNGFNLNVQSKIYTCQYANLTDSSITAGSSKGIIYKYFNDALGTSILYKPDSVNVSGTYFIRGVNQEGCSNILPIEVVRGLSPMSIADPAPVNYPGTVDLTKTFVYQKDFIYNFYNDSNLTIPLNNYKTIKTSGTYYIEATNSSGCIGITPITVTINSPLVITVSVPNTFTPNNDGVNDYFYISIPGTATFNSLKIYNRLGQLLFISKDQKNYWDGKYNGKNLPAGVYYWIFEGQGYNNSQLIKAGSITLIR